MARRPTTGASIPVPAIHVCPLRLLPATVATTGARHVITVINEQAIPPTPEGVATADHLRIGINDIAEPQDGLVHPGRQHIAEIIAFARRWNRQGPLVVHCLAGISRSTAAAFIALCDLNPGTPEAAIATAIRAQSATAMPNVLMVALADQALAREGRMIRALADLGQGTAAMEGIPFALPADLVSD